MKTTFSTLLVICLTSFLFMGGCLKNITSVKFDYQSEATFLTDSLLTIGDHTFDSSVFTSGLTSELEKNGASPDMLDVLKLKTVEVSFNTPDSASNFDKFESFELWISAEGLSAVKIASKNPVLNSLSTIKMDVNKNENLMNYFKSPTFSYEIKGRNKAPLYPMDLKVNATYEVKASSK
jgi:hypothetical protein